ncbi:GNAT family N-acetyltransferase [Chondrinema litorale]|uniref:GNAT family N-acetyltransferase n=1 Tax=Chondrinema litorale TaxID=2994555 RepID=UPI002542B6A7|nr:GNAT family N-acetyltransferase [Chondrinema litorale]UZR93848.1 GNAT family N-acetyltransferase [Chondrinema litorale]
MSSFNISEGSIAQVVEVSKLIAEFSKPYKEDEYVKRLHTKKHLILIAKQNDKIIGFKVGYAKNENTFYSWMGGVLAEYRKSGVALALMQAQEEWAKKHHFNCIEIKTRNCFKGMLILCIKQNYLIVSIENKENTEQNRIILQKQL